MADLARKLIIGTDNMASRGLVLGDVLRPSSTKKINLEALRVSLARVNVPLLVPANDLSTAKRVRLNERKLERFATETLVRRSEDRPLAVLNVIRIWGDVVREYLAIYERAAGEESAATGIGSWIVGGGSVAALEDLELWWVRSDATVLVGLRLKHTIEVKRHGLASGGYKCEGDCQRHDISGNVYRYLTVVHVQVRVLLHLKDIAKDPRPMILSPLESSPPNGKADIGLTRRNPSRVPSGDSHLFQGDQNRAQERENIFQRDHAISPWGHRSKR